MTTRSSREPQFSEEPSQGNGAPLHTYVYNLSQRFSTSSGFTRRGGGDMVYNIYADDTPGFVRVKYEINLSVWLKACAAATTRDYYWDTLVNATSLEAVQVLAQWAGSAYFRLPGVYWDYHLPDFDDPPTAFPRRNEWLAIVQERPTEAYSFLYSGTQNLTLGNQTRACLKYTNTESVPQYYL